MVNLNRLLMDGNMAVSRCIHFRLIESNLILASPYRRRLFISKLKVDVRWLVGRCWDDDDDCYVINWTVIFFFFSYRLFSHIRLTT